MLVLAGLLSGCIVVPVDPYYGHGWGHHHFDRDDYGYRHYR